MQSRFRQVGRLVTALLLLVLTSCQPPAPPRDTSSGAAPAATARTSGPAGSIVIGRPALTAATLDPSVIAGSTDGLTQLWPIFDALTALHSDGKLAPGLAKEWKAVDDRTWVFTLGDYRFQNGRAVTVQDVLDTFARYRDPANKSVILNSFNTVDTIAADGTTGIRITTKSPDPVLPNLLSYALIMPMQELKAAGDVEFYRKPIGTGPFRLESADFSTSIRYSAMGSDFVSPRGTPKVAALELKVLPENSARAAGLQSGDLDFALTMTEDSVSNLERAGFVPFRTPLFTTFHFLLDPSNGPTKDARVRQAINYAVDKDAVGKAIYGPAAVTDGQLIGPNVLGHNPDIKPYPYDVRKARDLMAAAGYPNGFKTTMTATTLTTLRGDLAVAVASYLKEIGIETDIQVKEQAAWIADFYAPPARRAGIWVEGLAWNQSFEANAVWRWFSSDTTVEGGRRWDDETFDKLYQQAKTTIDPQKRAATYQQAGAYLHDQAPVLFGWAPPSVYVGRKGITAPALNDARFVVMIDTDRK